MTMKVSSGWFFGALQDARRLRSELWEERSAAASAAVVAAGELAALRAADGRAASPGREGAIDPLKEEASLLGWAR